MSPLNSVLSKFSIWDNPLLANHFFISQGFQVLHARHNGILIWNFSFDKAAGWTGTNFLAPFEKHSSEKEDEVYSFRDSLARAISKNMGRLHRSAPTYLVFPNNLFSLYHIELDTRRSSQLTPNYLKWLLSQNSYIDTSRFHTQFKTEKSKSNINLSASSTCYSIIEFTKRALVDINLEQSLPEVALFQSLEFLKNTTASFIDDEYTTSVYFNHDISAIYVNTSRNAGDIPIDDGFLSKAISDNYSGSSETIENCTIRSEYNAASDDHYLVNKGSEKSIKVNTKDLLINYFVGRKVHT